MAAVHWKFQKQLTRWQQRFGSHGQGEDVVIWFDRGWGFAAPVECSARFHPPLLVRYCDVYYGGPRRRMYQSVQSVASSVQWVLICGCLRLIIIVNGLLDSPDC